MNEQLLLCFSAVVEVLIAYQLYSHFFSRRDSGKAKMVLVSVALIVIMSATNLLGIFQFNTAMALLLYTLYIRLLFKCKWWQAILWSLIFVLLGMAAEIATSFGVSCAFNVHVENTMIMTWYKLIVYIISKSFLFVLVKIIITVFPSDKDVELDKTALYLILFPMLVILNEFLLVRLTMQLDLSRGTMFFSMIFGIGLILGGFYIIVLYDRWLQKKQLEKELLLAKIKEDANEKFFLLQERSLAEARSSVHDFKNQMLNLKALYESSNPDASVYHEKLMDSLKCQMSRQLIDMNNKVFSNIFLRAQIRCEQFGIKFESQISYYDLGFIDPMDTSSLFDNAFDNALQACDEVNEEQNRRIDFRLYRSSRYVVCEIINSYSSPIFTEAEALISSKKDKERHGFGLQNIRATALKYGGDIIYSFNDSEFNLSIRLLYDKK